jgi:hypothetical protein
MVVVSRAVSLLALGGTALLLFPAGGIVACGSRSELYALGGPGPSGDASPGVDASEDASEDALPDVVAGDGYCMGKEITVALNAPNLYFVIDHSTSMKEMNKWPNVRTAVAGVINQIGAGARFGAMMFPGAQDVSSCATGVEVMPLRQGDPNGATANAFLAATTADPTGGTPTAATLKTLVPKLSGLTGTTYVILVTDGGPNCNSGLTCPVYQCTANIDGVSSSCQPDFAINCCDPTMGGNNQSCLDDTNTIAAAKALHSAGIPLYVMGIPGSGLYQNVLDQVAIAGGTARSTEPLYYQVQGDTDAGGMDLTSAFNQIVAKTGAGCRFTLVRSPSFPTGVEAILGGTVIAQGGADGWVLQGTTLTLSGTSCTMVRSAGSPSLRFFDGCKG